MEPVESAILEAFAGDWFYSLPYVMAWLAEMMSSEAEPSGCLAAVATLVHDVLRAVLFAASFSSRFSDREALTTHEGLRLLLGLLFLFLFISILLG